MFFLILQYSLSTQESLYTMVFNIYIYIQCQNIYTDFFNKENWQQYRHITELHITKCVQAETLHPASYFSCITVPITVTVLHLWFFHFISRLGQCFENNQQINVVLKVLVINKTKHKNAAYKFCNFNTVYTDPVKGHWNNITLPL